MGIGFLCLVVLSMLALGYAYQCWVKPFIAARLPYEYGHRRNSWRSRFRRSAWRHDNWSERLVSLFCLVLMILSWWAMFGYK